MANSSISVLCIQETHLFGNMYFDSFLHLLSSRERGDSTRGHAGVGFLVALRALRSVISFPARSPKVAVLKMRVDCGVLSGVSAWVPHGGHAFDS